MGRQLGQGTRYRHEPQGSRQGHPGRVRAWTKRPEERLRRECSPAENDPPQEPLVRSTPIPTQRGHHASGFLLLRCPRAPRPRDNLGAGEGCGGGGQRAAGRGVQGPGRGGGTRARPPGDSGGRRGSGSPAPRPAGPRARQQRPAAPRPLPPRAARRPTHPSWGARAGWARGPAGRTAAPAALRVRRGRP